MASNDFNSGIALYRMLPTGQAWPKENEDSNLRSLVHGLAYSIDEYINTLKTVVIDQFYPGQAGIFMEDWEDLLGLPKCGQTGQSIQDRLAQIIAMFRISPYSNAQFFIDIAEVFGFTVSVIPDGPDSITLSGTTIFGGYYNGVYTKYGIKNNRLWYRYLDVDIYFRLGSEVSSYPGWGLVHVGGPGLPYYNSYTSNIVPIGDGNPVADNVWQSTDPAADPVPTITLDPAFTPDPFKITLQVDSVETVYFRAGRSSAGEPLQTTRANAILECILNFFKPAHSYLSFI